jgi:hypothetical protein
VNKKLKARIIEKFGTQTDFAFFNNIPESTVSRVLNGRWNLNEDEIERWSKVLGHDISDLLGQ